MNLLLAEMVCARWAITSGGGHQGTLRGCVVIGITILIVVVIIILLAFQQVDVGID